MAIYGSFVHFVGLTMRKQKDSKNEMYSWVLINIYDRFWALISMGFK